MCWCCMKDVMITTSHLKFVFKTSLTECLHEYEYYDTGNIMIQIQRYEPDSGYRWHHDDNVVQSQEQRSMTFIWYLNTIEEDGYTEFVDGTRVKSKKEGL